MSIDWPLLAALLFAGFVCGAGFGYAVRAYISRRRRRRRSQLFDQAFELSPPSRADNADTGKADDKAESVTLAPKIEKDGMLPFIREKRRND